MNIHEKETILKFIVKNKQERYLSFINNLKNRKKFTSELSHFKHFNPESLRIIEKKTNSSSEIFLLLNQFGAGADCYVISEKSEFDNREFKLKDILEEIIGSGIGTIISCIPGKLAIYEGEIERYLLYKP